MNNLEIALKYHRHGFRVIPVEADKMPRFTDDTKTRRITWKQYRESQTEDQINALFKKECWGLAILTGVDGLEVIDVDQKYDPYDTLIARYAKHCDMISGNAVPLTDLTIQATKNGGFHLLYFCDEIGANDKLATRQPLEGETGPKVLIETRGTGGYIVAWPSPGYCIDLGDIWSVPTITPEQRAHLFQAARDFDEPGPAKAKSAAPAPVNEAAETPWDDYNAKTHVVDLLQSYGWTYVYEDSARVYLRRPGDTDTKTSGNYHKEKGLFKCHSTSTPLETEKGLPAYAVYVAYEHQGDYRAAARALRRLGYGKQGTRTKTLAIVTREATAKIMRVKSPDFEWRAHSPHSPPTIELRGREVLIYPAFGEESAWADAARLMQVYAKKVAITDILEKTVPAEHRTAGLDVASFI